MGKICKIIDNHPKFPFHQLHLTWMNSVEILSRGICLPNWSAIKEIVHTELCSLIKIWSRTGRQKGKIWKCTSTKSFTLFRILPISSPWELTLEWGPPLSGSVSWHPVALLHDVITIFYQRIKNPAELSSLTTNIASSNLCQWRSPKWMKHH